jgi:hypothetical protein
MTMTLSQTKGHSSQTKSHSSRTDDRSQGSALRIGNEAVSQLQIQI